MLKVIIVLSMLLLSTASMAERLPADPTRPSLDKIKSIGSGTDKPTYSVSWLKIGSQTQVAVVNGQRVQVGDEVDGAKVLSIAHSGVTLDVGNNKQLISLAESKGFTKVKSGQ